MGGKQASTVDSQLDRRRLRLQLFAIVIILLVIIALVDHFGAFGYRGDDWKTFDHQSCTVTSVVDGDTLHIRSLANNSDVKVRLLGVDAPELRTDQAPDGEHWAQQSLSYTRGRLEGKQVIVRLEPTATRDRFGRLLAYLYVNETDNFNLDLIHDGQAYADRRFKHTYRPQFEQAEGEARKKGRGLWKDLKDDQMPAWRQRWLEERREHSTAAPQGSGAAVAGH